MPYPFGLLFPEFGEVRVIAGDLVRRPVGLPVADEEEVHDTKLVVRTDCLLGVNTMGLCPVPPWLNI